MKKIVITGGLGYIGTELCKLYSGETRYTDITVVDNRFISERVKQLREWGFNFIQASILDKDVISNIVKDADVVYHFAGITDVAYTKAEENSNSDKITEVGIQGSRNIIDSISDECKLLFPSTHVVYEGFKEAVYDVSEEEPTCAQLTYACGKVQTELDLEASSKNYTILRLASVYGYSTDTMRIGIMPNLFSKIASQNGTIKLFSKGIQLKSLVPLIDVARCFKFMGEREDISRETFHLSKENMTVKEVAEICKEINPDLTLIETDDEIPNLGYTISNKKLLETGFRFRYDLKQNLTEMIANWSKRNIRPELEYTVQGGKEYIDDRGKISNYELTEPINLIGYIESKKGTVRANHYHPIQEQKCLLIKGRYVSVIQDLADPKAQIKTQLINEGDIAIIKPNVAHTMVFLEDSIFLNLVRGEREHDNYGVTHTHPYELVNEEFRLQIMENYSSKCRASSSKNLKPVLSLGKSPLANNLLNSQEDKDELYPLEMVYCPDSHNCQLSYIVPAEKMFDHYLYVSSTAKSFRKHFEDAAEKYIKQFNLTNDSLVIDIGSNDGIALKPLKEKGIKVLGVEPAKNIAKMANDADIPTMNKYFDCDIVDDIKYEHGKADLITASNVFAHADNLEEIAVSAFDLLDDKGCFVIEVQYLVDTINDLTFDNIYHEHANYWSVTSLNNFFNRLGYKINKVEHIDTHGGSIRVYIKGKSYIPHVSVREFLEREEEFGITEYKTYLDFADRVEQAKSNVVKNIKDLKDKGLTLVGYGSPAKATTSLNYYGITTNEIDYIVDDNPLKHNKILPGVRIPIYSREKLNENLPDVIIVMAWNFFDEIKSNNQDLIDKGVRFISIKELRERQ
jgi:nucleoside-diphosphate-sugar epimerase/SAM-dependent methyltransferase/quercetin dioxygenase-like cupin family protein